MCHAYELIRVVHSDAFVKGASFLVNAQDYEVIVPKMQPLSMQDINQTSFGSADLAQLGERKTEDLDVAGSIPAIRKYFFFTL